MKKPTDITRRPTRRFSAIRAPVKRAVESGPEATAGQDPVPLPGDDADVVEAGPSERPGSGDEAPMAVAAEPPSPAPASRGPSEPGPRAKADDEARVAKVMSRAGLCSRREAEAWIGAGRVAVNGAVIESPALNIGPGDKVTVDDYPIDKPDHTRLFMFHKTRGLVTTARDPEGRPTIYDALPGELPRLITIGRLDINTEGLLLLTNDGGLARLLELPSTGWLRRYRVRANGQIDQARLDTLKEGVTVEGIHYGGIDARLDRVQGANVWLTLGLREGKNREVKRVLDHLGLGVTRLIRISFGPFQLGDLAENAVEEVRTRVLRDQLGSALAKQAGLDLAPAEPDQPAAPVAVQEPRRKTSRSATADRRGRAVAVERIASAERPSPGRSRPDRAGGKPARGPEAAARPRVAEERPGRAPARPAGEAPARTEGRPARTLRQADADAQRRESRDRPAPGPGRVGDRAGRERPAGPRGEAPRGRPGLRDGERPRTGRNKDDRPRTGRSGGGAERVEGAKRGAPGGRSGPGRPGGKPPAGKGGAPGRPGRPPGGGGGGGGRGRPRG